MHIELDNSSRSDQGPEANFSNEALGTTHTNRNSPLARRVRQRSHILEDGSEIRSTVTDGALERVVYASISELVGDLGAREVQLGLQKARILSGGYGYEGEGRALTPVRIEAAATENRRN